MSYVYSNGLCREALRILDSEDDFESRLSRAFSEMSVAQYGDTSDEIWEKWKKLKERYRIVTGEIYQQRQEGIDTPEMKAEYQKFAEELKALINEWEDHNKQEIAKGNLKNPNKA